MMTKRTKALLERVSRLEQRLDLHDQRHAAPLFPSVAAYAWLPRITTAVHRGTAALTVGTRVGYRPADCIRWTGAVVRRPAWAKMYGMTGEEFVYVLRDGDDVVRGCYPSRLVRL